jgi:hypothetical protein
MAMYICENCGCVENTALGNWWVRDTNNRLAVNPVTNKPFPNGMALCSACAPDKFVDGKYRHIYRDNKPRTQGWHNQFNRQLWDGSTKVENPMDYTEYNQKFKITWEQKEIVCKSLLE